MRTIGLLLLIAFAGCTTRNLDACACPETHDPVCAADGVTYDNSCWAECAGTRATHSGFCSSDGGCSCSKQGMPVCGSDRKTYPNACLANCAGVSVIHN